MGEKANKGGKKVITFLGGNILVKEKFSKQFPFIVFITVLLMIIIGNTYIAEERTREIAKTSKELNDLHVEYIQLKSAVMQASKQSVLSAKLKGYGLKEPTEPIRKISTTDNTQTGGLPSVSEEQVITSSGSNEAAENSQASNGEGPATDSAAIKTISKI